MSFADPEHLRIERQFDGVTAMLKDPSRGLVYLANAEGLWVFRMEPATDIELEEQCRQYILYNHQVPLQSQTYQSFTAGITKRPVWSTPRCCDNVAPGRLSG